MEYRQLRITYGSYVAEGWYLPKTKHDLLKWGEAGVLAGVTTKGYILYTDPVALANGSKSFWADPAYLEIAKSGVNVNIENHLIPSDKAVREEWPYRELVLKRQYFQANGVIPTFFDNKITTGEMLWYIREGIMELVLYAAKKFGDEHSEASKAECYMNGFEYAMNNMYAVIGPLSGRVGAEPGGIFFGMQTPDWVMDKDALGFIFPWNRSIGASGSKNTGKSKISKEDRSALYDCADLWMDRSSTLLEGEAGDVQPKEVWVEGTWRSHTRWYRFRTQAEAGGFVNKSKHWSPTHPVWSRDVLK